MPIVVIGAAALRRASGRGPLLEWHRCCCCCRCFCTGVDAADAVRRRRLGHGPHASTSASAFMARRWITTDADTRVTQQDSSQSSKDSHHQTTVAPWPGSEILRARLANIGITHPTEIQRLSYADITARKHCVLAAEGGAGKTLAYLIPLLNRLHSEPCPKPRTVEETPHTLSPRAIIFTEGRELMQQLISVIASLNQPTALEAKLRSDDAQQKSGQILKPWNPLLVTTFPTPEGIPIGRFMHPDIVVTSPEFLNLHFGNRLLPFLRRTDTIVVDEADSTVSRDENVKKVINATTRLNGNTHYILSTATILRPMNMNQYDPLFQSFLMLRGVKKIATEGHNRGPMGMTHTLLVYETKDREQMMRNLDERRLRRFLKTAQPVAPTHVRMDALIRMIDDAVRGRILPEGGKGERWIIFVESSKTIEEIVQEIRRASSAYPPDTVVLTHLINREERAAALRKFVVGRSDDGAEAGQRRLEILIGTNFISRGLDFKDIRAVVNFDMPRDVQTYFNRVGRGARGPGAVGECVSFISPRDHIVFGRIKDALPEDASRTIETVYYEPPVDPALTQRRELVEQKAFIPRPSVVASLELVGRKSRRRVPEDCQEPFKKEKYPRSVRDHDESDQDRLGFRGWTKQDHIERPEGLRERLGRDPKWKQRGRTTRVEREDERSTKEPKWLQRGRTSRR